VKQEEAREGLAVQVSIEDIVDQLSSLFTEMIPVFNDGYRCRYDLQTLAQYPLGSGEPNRIRDHCLGCEFPGKKTDPYCRIMTRMWNVLKKLPKNERDKYRCTCPNFCKSLV
jgi:hypothetical protein